jgi:Cu-processing system permease protein
VGCTQSVSLSLTSISGLAVSIFVGIGLIQKEIQKKTVLTLLAKPIARYQFVLGKYLGLLALLALHVMIMGTLILGVLWSQDMPIKPMYFTAIGLLYFEIALVTSVAILFSSFSTPILSSLFTVGFFMAGHESSGY